MHSISAFKSHRSHYLTLPSEYLLINYRIYGLSVNPFFPVGKGRPQTQVNLLSNLYLQLRQISDLQQRVRVDEAALMLQNSQSYIKAKFNL